MSGCGSEAEASEAEPAASSLAPLLLEAADPAEETKTAVGVSYDPRKSLAPMIKAVGPAVVAVYTRKGRAFAGGGSGFILSEEGLVVTNHHVVDSASAVEVRLSDGQRFEAEVLGSDAATDLALLQLDGATSLPEATLGRSGPLEVGDWVVAIGNPMGLEHSASVGIVSGKSRGSLGLYRDSYLDFLQTDADIAPGSSGGPLFDLEGRVVGINTAVGSGSRPGFAIPVDQAKRVVEQLRDHGRVARGWLGAASVEGSPRVGGAEIGTVYEGTPAEAAGLREGDFVTEVDGEAIANFGDLRARIATTAPGKELALTVERGGRTLSVGIQLEERPSSGALERLRPSRGAVAPATPAPGRKLPFGMSVPTEESEAEADDLRLGVSVREKDDGLHIALVEEGSLGDALGLRKGDVLQKIGGKEIDDVGDVRDALQSDDAEIEIRFLREGAKHVVTLERS